MKKTLFMVAAVALAMTACNKEEINNNEGAADSQVPSVVVEFTASLNDAPAKTTLDIASNKTHWVGGDAISINGVKFTTAEDGASVKFTNAEELPADFSAPYIAKYPYTASGNLEIPAAQDAVIGNFDADAVAAVAYSTDNTLAFKNATSLLKFQVPEACSSVTLTSDEALAGALTITNPAEDDGLPTFSAEEKSVTISGSFVAGNDYYVAVLPGVKNNFVVRIDGYLSRTAASVNIARSTIADMKTLPEPTAIYVNIADVKWTNVNLHIYSATEGLTSWPGNKLTITKEINGKTYYKSYVDKGSTLGLVFNNGTANSNFKLEIKDVVLTDDKYFRLSARGPIEVDPNDVTTFEYAIYVYDQKSKNVAPNLYVWDDNDAFKTMYGGDYASWPGEAFKMECYYHPADDNGWRHYYYYIIPSSLYDSSFNYIINKDGQTNDLTSTNVSGDLYIGYWYNGENDNGFWVESDRTIPITTLPD